MRKTNTILSIILILLIVTGAVFLWGASIKVDASARMENGELICDMTIKNPGVLPMEYLEFSVDQARIKQADMAGTDIPPMSSVAASITIENIDATPITIEIGAYVMGIRLTTHITIN